MIANSESLGVQVETCIVNSVAYTIFQPSAEILEKVGNALGELNDGMDITFIVKTIDKERRAKALSLLIRGDDSISEELLNGSDEELTQGIIRGFSFVDVRTAGRMSGIVRNVSKLIAR